MSDRNRDAGKPPAMKKNVAGPDYNLYMIAEAINEQSRKLDRLDDNLDRKIGDLNNKLDRKFDKVIEDLTVIRERTASVEAKVEHIPGLNTRIQKLEKWIWAVAGAVVVLSVLGNWLLRLYTAQ